MLRRQLLVVFADFDDLISNAVKLCYVSIVWMIGKNQWDIAMQLSAAMAVQQVDQAMVITRYEDDHPRAVRRLRQSPANLKALCCRCKGFREMFGRNIELCGIELDPHQE